MPCQPGRGGRRTAAEEIADITAAQTIKLPRLRPDLTSVLKFQAAVINASARGEIDARAAKVLIDSADKIRLCIVSRSPKIERLEAMLEQAEKLHSEGKAREQATRQHRSDSGVPLDGLEAILNTKPDLNTKPG